MTSARASIAATGAIVAAIAAALPAAAHAQPERRPLSARIQAVDTPSALDRGEVATAILDVRNTGLDTWPADGDVRLSYHWTRADGSTAVGGGRRAHLPIVVPPGGTVRLCAPVEAPDEAGDLRLDWDLVKEGVAWFSHRDPESLLRQPVRVGDARAYTGGERPAPIAWWLIVSVAHLLVAAAWAAVPRPGAGARPAIDVGLFETTLFAVGTLHGVLFVASMTTGIGDGRGVWWLAAFDAIAAAALLYARRAHATDPDAGAPLDAAPTTAPARASIVAIALQAAGAVALVTLAISWVRIAARSFHISGSDAAHYHVPNVVNLALGASPFDLMPTPHAYPMGASLVGAWFALPVGDPWIIEVAMLLFFGLLAASLIRAFTLATGQPGLAWVPWLLLAFMATPLFQHASLFSADLPFTAASAAAATRVIAWRTRGPLTARAAVGDGLAFGLLCGVKTTGVPMTILLLGAAAAVWAIRRRGRVRDVRRWRPAFVAVGLVAWLAGGGLWLVRNQVNHGSPVAPSGLRIHGVTIFKGETLAESATYYSVAGDMAAAPGYPLRHKAAYYTRQWLGPVGPPVLALLALLAIDAGVPAFRRRRRGREPDPDAGGDDPRLAMLIGGAAIAIAFLWLLAHAPWSSLDWTRGLSLRYALPVIAGAGFLAFLGLFPRTIRWYDDSVPAAVGGVLLAGVSVHLFLQGRATIPATAPDPVPALDWVSCGVAVALLAAARLAMTTRRGRLGGLAALAAGIWLLATGMGARDAALVAAAQQQEAHQVRCAAANAAGELERHGAIQLAMLAAERRQGVTCPQRRVFLGAAFDMPLELQSLPWSTLVFEARQAALDPSTGLDAGRSTCDYAIVTRAELETLRGSRLLQRLRAVRPWAERAEGGGFVAFAATADPPPASK